MLELLPYPFCGGEAKVMANDGVRIICTSCYCQTMVRTDGCIVDCKKNNALERAVKSWNRRPSRGAANEKDQV